MKIYVLGQSGSGKTYFSQKLAKRYHLEHIELDKLHQHVNYNLPSFYEAAAKLLDTKKDWIVDGKYKGIRERLINEADKIYFLDLPYRNSAFTNLKREIAQNKIISLKFIKHLFKVSREFRGVRKEIYQQLEQHKDKTEIFKSRRDVNKFLESLLRIRRISAESKG